MKINIALLYMSTLAILVRAHGDIYININPDLPIEVGELFEQGGPPENRRTDLINFRAAPYNIPNLAVVSLAKLGGVCYGNSDIERFVSGVNQYYQQNPTDTNSKVNEVFGNQPPTALRQHVNQLFGISYAPEITNMSTGWMLNKVYTKYDNNSGVILFSQDGKDAVRVHMLNGALATLTAQLQANNGITRAQILQTIAPFGYQNVYLIDLTCNAYKNAMQNVSPLRNETVDWINARLLENNIKGGIKVCKKYKKCKKHRKTRKNKKRKGNNKKTKSKK